MFAPAPQGMVLVKKVESSQADPAERPRKPYQTPLLAVYGKLADLTASGSNNHESESVGSTMICGPSFMYNRNCVGPV